jgi:hypothetical protein
MKNRTPGVWLAGAMLLLAFPILYWSRAVPGQLIAAPVTPLDGSDSAAARQWSFLRRARAVVPAGATYTVIAPTRDVEMNLYMMSLGLLPDARGLPSSYHGISTEDGEHARYVLAYEDPPLSEEARLRVVFPEGKVYERPGAPR